LQFRLNKFFLIFYAFSLFFGLSGLFLQSKGKILAVSTLILIMIFLIIGLSSLEKNYDKK